MAAACVLQDSHIAAGRVLARGSGVEVEAELLVHGFAGVSPALLGPHVEEEMHGTLQKPAAAGGEVLFLQRSRCLQHVPRPSVALVYDKCSFKILIP